MLSLHYNGSTYKAKGFKLIAYSLCLGNISKDYSVADTMQTGPNGYMYDFSVNYKSIGVDGILDIDKYLMKKKKCLLDY